MSDELRGWVERWLRPAMATVRRHEAPMYTPVWVENPAALRLEAYEPMDVLPLKIPPALIPWFAIPPEDYERHWELEGPHP